MPHPDKAGVVDWRTSKLRAALEYLVADVLGARGTDALVDRLLNATGLGRDGRVEIGLDGLLPSLPPLPLPWGGSLQLSTLNLTLSGLDTITDLRPFIAPPNASRAGAGAGAGAGGVGGGGGGGGGGDPAALMSFVALESLGVRLSLTAAFSGGGSTLPPPGQPSSEPLALDVGATLHNLSVGATGRLPLNLTSLLALPLGSLGAPPCLLRSVLDGAALSSLNLSARRVELHASGNVWGTRPQSATPPLVSADLSPPLADFTLSPVLSAVVSTVATLGLQAMLSKAHTAGCPKLPPAPPTYLNLSALEPLQKLATEAAALTDAELDASLRRLASSIHRLWDRLSGSTAPWAVGYMPLPPLSLALHDGKVGDVRINLANASLSHLDGLYGLSFRTHPDEPTLLSGGVGLGNGSSAPLTLSAVVHLQLDGEWHALRADALLRGVRLHAAAKVEVDTSVFSELSVGALADPRTLCFLRPLHAIGLRPNLTGISLDPVLADNATGMMDLQLRPARKRRTITQTVTVIVADGQDFNRSEYVSRLAAFAGLDAASHMTVMSVRNATNGKDFRATAVDMRVRTRTEAVADAVLVALTRLGDDLHLATRVLGREVLSAGLPFETVDFLPVNVTGGGEGEGGEGLPLLPAHLHTSFLPPVLPTNGFRA